MCARSSIVRTAVHRAVSMTSDWPSADLWPSRRGQVGNGTAAGHHYVAPTAGRHSRAGQRAKVPSFFTADRVNSVSTISTSANQAGWTVSPPLPPA